MQTELGKIIADYKKRGLNSINYMVLFEFYGKSQNIFEQELNELMGQGKINIRRDFSEFSKRALTIIIK